MVNCKSKEESFSPSAMTGYGGDDFYDIVPDDRRSFMARRVDVAREDEGEQLIIVQNFFQELSQVVPEWGGPSLVQGNDLLHRGSLVKLTVVRGPSLSRVGVTSAPRLAHRWVGQHSPVQNFFAELNRLVQPD